MTSFRNSFTVDFPIENVWEFYTNINHLKIITPREMKIEILKATDEVIREGAEFSLKARLVIDSKWQSKITHLSRHEYIDEMIRGGFKKWEHSHKFIGITANKTEIVDRIDFKLPFGYVGRLFERYAMTKLAEIFQHREKATIEALQRLKV